MQQAFDGKATDGVADRRAADRQDPAYRASVLGDAPRVAVEAASPFGWTRYVASEADVVGMTSFGASGPIKALYEHFGLTAENVARKARALL